MRPPKRKQPLLPTIGFGVLMLQALSVPWAIRTVVAASTDQPTWAAGLYLATDLAALATLGVIAFGRQIHNDRARWAPTVLVAPAWLTMAILSPLRHDSFGVAAIYALYAVVVAVMSAGPFLTRQGIALFKASTAHGSEPVAVA